MPSAEPSSPAPDLLAAALGGIPAALPAWGRGWCAAAACIIEASVPKPGNVHPAADFADLCHAELVAAGIAIGPAMEAAGGRPLGRSILEAVTASRCCTRSNANLGIVLAVAPLAAATAVRPEAVAAVLDGLGAADAGDIWRAIAIAGPGGMGTTERCDLAGPPPADIMEAMRLAAPRDLIARLWSGGYGELFDGVVCDLEGEITRRLDRDVRRQGAEAPGRPAAILADAVVLAFLRQLARAPDSLVARRHGDRMAADVSARAAAILSLAPVDRPAAVAAFDGWLRRPLRVNPGTTADLVAAAVYILLRDGRLRPLVEPLPAPHA